jgi:SAM-dependent methyltransferase
MRELYTQRFYKVHQDGSEGSADIIVPALLSVFPARSVVDIGCGIGTWLRAFERNGVTDYLGYDGDYVPADMLRIPRERFRAADLRRISELGRRFDIACSLEVAEHLPESSAEHFVDLLVNAAPVVLFSAAIPNQGGDGHVNERWQSYWSELFSNHGYAAIDCIRPAIFGNPQVAWWYRQNILVYCDSEHLPRNAAPLSDPLYLNRIDPGMVEAIANPVGVRGAVGALGRDAAALARALHHRLLARSG